MGFTGYLGHDVVELGSSNVVECSTVDRSWEHVLAKNGSNRMHSLVQNAPRNASMVTMFGAENSTASSSQSHPVVFPVFPGFPAIGSNNNSSSSSPANTEVCFLTRTSKEHDHREPVVNITHFLTDECIHTYSKGIHRCWGLHN